MRKRRLIEVAVILLIMMSAAVFAAQFISDISESTIKASNVKIKLVMLEENAAGEEVPISGDTTIEPGDEVSRIAKVQNTGNEEAWIRLKPLLEISGKLVPISTQEWLKLNDKDIDKLNWTQEGDYWYYQKPLAPGETSMPLFKSVTISNSVDSTFDGANLKVEAEGTQVKNNGSTVFEAQGWPAN